MKKIIRLTEADLHDIIMEAINEMDPRTYASYAEKRAEQARGTRPMSPSQKRKNMTPQEMYSQASQGKSAAVSAFNDQYGYDKEYPLNGKITRGLNTRRYFIDRGSGDENYPYRARTYDAEDDARYAHGQTISFSKNGDDKVTHRHGAWGDNYEEWVDNNIWHPYDSIGRKQTKVAQQMAQGNGHYVKGKGWDANESVSKIDRIVKESLRRILKENEDLWHVQETIGGWRQEPVFSGTYDECAEYCDEYCTNGSYDIVSDEDLAVDYLNSDEDECDETEDGVCVNCEKRPRVLRPRN